MKWGGGPITAIHQELVFVPGWWPPGLVPLLEELGSARGAIRGPGGVGAGFGSPGGVVVIPAPFGWLGEAFARNKEIPRKSLRLPAVAGKQKSG